jgi:hypothetical protein
VFVYVDIACNGTHLCCSVVVYCFAGATAVLVSCVLAAIGLSIERFCSGLYHQGIIVFSCGWMALAFAAAAVGLAKMR